MNKQSYLQARVLHILLLFSTFPGLSLAQSPESFFPHHVGNRWDYAYWNGGFFEFYSHVITRDSVGTDGSHNLFYNSSSSPTYRIDTAHNVFLLPQDPFVNYLRYKLPADSCDSWENPQFGSIRWAWVARVDSAVVFSRRTVTKVFKYAPGNPCSLGSLEEDWLASGFGLIYTWREPWDIRYLLGCVIAGDTFGTLVSVPPITEDLSKAFALNQNYPNPFNLSTTIEFELPEASTVSIRVYDLIGQQVATIAEDHLVAGTHRIRWDSGALSSGVYLCRLQAKGNMRIIKMLLTK